ncbi:MAG: TIGR03790 family protein, partial [Puniceicoccales bacterium]
KARFPWTARMDAPAFYIGWWTHTPDGAFQERSYRLPPGSVAIHISSFSGQQLRKPNNRWSGALVERGVAATVGNVYEPYLGLTHQPHLFFSGLEDGMQAGQAAYYSLTGLSWNAIFIGDPLYQPSKVTLEQQLASLSVDDPWDQYVVLRKAEQIRAADGDDAAFTFLQRNYHRAPGLALSYAIAQGWESRSERQKGIETLEFVAGLPAFSPEDMGLAYQIADLLIQMQARETGYKILKVLANQARTDDAKIAFMQPAIPIAQQLGDRDQASQWQATVDGILQKRQEEAERRKAAREAKKKAAAN